MGDQSKTEDPIEKNRPTERQGEADAQAEYKRQGGVTSEDVPGSDAPKARKSDEDL